MYVTQVNPDKACLDAVLLLCHRHNIPALHCQTPFGSPRRFPFRALTLGHRWWSDITVLVCKNGGSVIRPSGAPLSIIAPDIVQRAFAKMDFHSKLVDAKFQLGVHFNLTDKQTETLKYLFHGRDCIGRSDVSAAWPACIRHTSELYFVPRALTACISARNGNFRGEPNGPACWRPPFCPPQIMWRK